MTAAPTRTDTLLSIEHVSLSYGPNQVLRDVNAHIEDLIRPDMVTGQVVGLLSPSGGGKTTLLKVIAGLLKPSAGTVSLGTARTPACAGEVGLVFQNSWLYPNRDVLSNLVVGARMAKSHPTVKEATQRAVDILNDFGLLDKAHLYPCQLSGGQKQRVAISQQILCSDHFLCMDEPTAGLDPLAKAKVCQLITKVANRDDLNTVILCSHDIASVVAVCDEVWLLGRDPGLPGARIVETVDLIDRGLTWQPDITSLPAYAETVRELQERFKTL